MFKKDTKGTTRSRKAKTDRQYIGQKKTRRNASNDLQHNTLKIFD